MGVAQVVERSLLTPGVSGSNPVIGKHQDKELSFTVNFVEKAKINKKRPGMVHFKSII